MQEGYSQFQVALQHMHRKEWNAFGTCTGIIPWLSPSLIHPASLVFQIARTCFLGKTSDISLKSVVGLEWKEHETNQFGAFHVNQSWSMKGK